MGSCLKTLKLCTNNLILAQQVAATAKADWLLQMIVQLGHSHDISTHYYASQHSIQKKRATSNVLLLFHCKNDRTPLLGKPQEQLTNNSCPRENPTSYPSLHSLPVQALAPEETETP
jgi:hypothetical protein